MMEDLFREVLRLSIYGTVAGMGVLLIGLLVNRVRAPKWIVLCLWGLVGLRLICPITVSSDFSIFRMEGLSKLVEEDAKLDENNVDDFHAAAEVSSQYDAAVEAGIPIEMTERGKTAYYYEKEDGTLMPAKTTQDSVISLLAEIWLSVIAVLWLWAVSSYLRLKLRLRFAIKVSNGIYEADAVSSPCVVGYIQPKIYLTPNLSDTQREHILLHEQMHIQYKDYIWKLLSFAIMSIHWFNPILWVMYKVFQGELEKACDERVIRRLGEEKKEDYSESLLSLAREHSWKLSAPLSFGEDNTKGRIKSILRYKKPVLVVTVCVVAVAAVICVVLMTGAPKEEKPETVASEDTVADSVFEELVYDEVIYQAKRDGIHRISGDKDEVIYDVYPGLHPAMTIYGNKLYFKTDKSYQKGALEWADTTVRWISLETDEIGDVELSYSGSNVPTIQNYTIYQGIMLIHYSTGSKTETDVIFLEGEKQPVGNDVEWLSEEEEQLLGASMRQMILENRNQLVNLSGEVQGESIIYLDMDGDGDSEKIFLKMYEKEEDVRVGNYRLQIDDASLEASGENMEQTLWALSLDGEEIFLVMYEDGPNEDTHTVLYKYSDGKVFEAGSMEADLRNCEIHEGMISGAIRKEVIQTDWIWVSWMEDESGMLEEVPQEVYGFVSLNKIDLLEQLPLHMEMGSQDTFEIEPQKVTALEISADGEWVLLETADGRQGWVHIENFEVVELQKNVMDVFAGQYLPG